MPYCLQRAVENVVVGRERAGMRGRRLDAVLGAARLEHDDRRALAHLACLVEERARIADALDIETDHLGGRIVGDVMQEIELVDVDLVADVDALADRQPLDLPGHDVEHERAGENAGLGEERNAARLPARKIDEAAHHADFGIDHADGVRAGEQQAGRPRDLAQPLLVGATLRARLGKSGGDDAGRARIGRHALLDGVVDVLLRQHDVDEIDLLRHVGQRRVGLDPHDLRRGTVDRIKRTVKFALGQIVEQHAARFGRIGRCADHRNGTRRYKRRDVSHERLLGTKHDQRVERDDAVLADHQGIDLDVRYLARDFGRLRQVGQAVQHACEGVAIGGWPPARAIEIRVAACSPAAPRYLHRAAGQAETTPVRSVSTKSPPRPNMMAGPNCGSLRSAQDPFELRRLIGLDQKSIERDAGRCAATRAAIGRQAASAASGVSTGNTTAPTSVLWVSSGATAFTTTGGPTASSALPAGAASRITCADGTGMP